MPSVKCVKTERVMPRNLGWREIGWFAVYRREPLNCGFENMREIHSFVRYMEHWEPPVIKAICEHFEYDRMHMDPRISEEEADEFKKAFLDNALANEWPVLTCGQPVTFGFLICRPEKFIGHIDLIGVHPDHRHRGIASILVAHFLAWAHDGGFDLCEAGTMEANSAACALYESMGFKRHETLRVFHK